MNKGPITPTILLIFLLISACKPPAGATGVPNEAAANPTAADKRSLIPTPTVSSPTSIPLEPGRTATVRATSTDVDVDGLAPNRQAMLPQCAADVDRVAAAGATRYLIKVNLNPDSFSSGAGLTLNGVADIHYTNTENISLSEIYFRLYPNLPGYGGQMIVETVTVGGRPVQPVLEAGDSAMRIPLASPLRPGAHVDLSLTFQSLAPAQIQRGYNIFSYTDHTAALAGFYPAVAVYDDEGWNIEVAPAYGDATYLDVSLYQVLLTVPQPVVVAASGSVLETTKTGNGTKTLFLASGPMRDFYMVLRQDYQVISETVDGTLVNSYYPPALEAGGTLALRYAADALRVFNQRFGQYPYAEFDIAATPTRAGGVEYPGIVVVTQNVYSQSGGFFQHATAHEVAHQWWYGLVGNDQIDEPWLDEALTNYSAAIYWEAAAGPEAAAQVIEDFFVKPYERAKEQGRDRAVVGSVGDFTEGEYGLFVYGKGPLFFHALRQEFGDDVFFDVMKNYYAAYKYKIAKAADFFEIVEQVSGKEIEPLVEQWLNSQESPN